MSRRPVYFKGGTLLLDEQGRELGYGAFESDVEYKNREGYLILCYDRIIADAKDVKSAKAKAKHLSKRKGDTALICKKVGEYRPY